MRKIGRRLAALLACVGTLLALSACASDSGRAAYAAFCRAPRASEMEWTVNGVAFRGSLSLAAGEGTAHERGACIRFSSPEALAGVVAVAEADGLRLSLDGVAHTLPAGQVTALCVLLRAFSPEAAAAALPDGEGGLLFKDGDGQYRIRLRGDGTVDEITYTAHALTLALRVGGAL